MITLVLGGAASGKSEFAEELILQYTQPRIYLATMENNGETAKRRIERHRLLRAEKGFQTIECPRNLEQLSIAQDTVVLLECVSNLFANEMYRTFPPCSGFDTAEKCLLGITTVAKQAEHIVIVSNNVFDDGVTYDPETEDYIHGLSMLNCYLADMSDEVFEVVCGIPILHKRSNEA